ncbi:Uma2 family endonuclease [Runella aurantiaca]|uniref:Uma2 family endonuclease n=1 Tax=Runella aurantiaca TaxID=2282308 RepID=A0A369I553_9BACT|nr:Uma2 family endonuclease [Runella aurantiaca]RDB03627.1 Uma2 family endonuclease [Runella aurantiaca]
MVQTTQQAAQLPRTLEEFLDWEPTDGFKYEWNDGELIKFVGMKQQQWYVYEILQNLFFEKGYIKSGTFMAEPDVMLTGLQMRRPDIAYFTREQIRQGRANQDVIPEFVVEVISTNDQIISVKNKLREYFKYGVKVAWLVYPDAQEVEVYTSYKEVKICTGTDTCSAAPVLPEFEISVAAIFAE